MAQTLIGRLLLRIKAEGLGEARPRRPRTRPAQVGRGRAARGPVAQITGGACQGRTVAVSGAAGALGGRVGGAGVGQCALDFGEAVGRHQVRMGGDRTVRQVSRESFAVAFLGEGDAHDRTWF